MTYVTFPIMTLLIVQFLTSILGALTTKLLYSKFRHCFRKAMLLQSEFNEAFAGPDPDLPIRLAKHVAIIATAFTFSGPIPIFILMIPVYLIVHFWVDKAMVLRVFRVPQNYN